MENMNENNTPETEVEETAAPETQVEEPKTEESVKITESQPEKKKVNKQKVGTYIKIGAVAVAGVLAVSLLVPLFKNMGNKKNQMVENTNVVAYDGSEVTVTFYHTMGANLKGVLDKHIAKFNELYPNIKIEHSSYGDYPGVRNQISTELTSNSAPSIAYCYPDHVALYNTAKAVLTLDDYMASTSTVTRADGTTETMGFTQEQINDFVPAYLAEGKAYGDNLMYTLPFAKSTEVLYYNKTEFAKNGWTVPKTWDEFRALIPKLQGKNYDLGMTRNVDMFVLQNGGSIFAEDGAKINYGDNIALDAFTTMCEFFTLYRLPISYDAANRFRTGEMPLIFADLTSFYNQFTAFATELKGLWSFTNVPGTVQEDGSINDTNIVTVSSLIMMKDAKERGRDAAAFKFIEWWTRSNIQSQYAKELIAFVGPSTKYNTANIEAYEEMDWSAKEIRLIKECASKLAGVPDMPGAYIIGRYTNFAFLAAYNDNASPSDELLGYVPLINKEFERKREELSKEFFIPTTYDWS